ncbi:MAG: hypothetical protein VYC17_05560 [Nitrospinota bacterium]|nr:hypothetical protein [Nitrospinota bacterium]
MKWCSITSVRIDGEPLLLGLEEVIEFLQQFPDPKFKALHAFRLAKILEHYRYPYQFRKNLTSPVETHNVFKLINIYGYGNCKQITMFMQYLLDHTGITNRAIALQSREDNESHFVNEVFYDGKWHLFDPDLGVYFTDNAGEIISVEDFAKQGFKTVANPFNFSRWKPFFPDLEDEQFRRLYESLFETHEEFLMTDGRYPWKKEFMSRYGLSRWYCAEQPQCFLPESCEITIRQRGKGIVWSQRVPSPQEFSFDNLIFSFQHGKLHFDLNNFPFPILEIRCTFSKNQESLQATIHIRGESYDLDLQTEGDLIEQVLTQNPDLFTLPIYSFSLHGNQELQQIAITTQASPARQKIFRYIKENNHK